MIEIGQAVYFIESRGLDPVIKFGIVRDLWEDNGFYHYAVDFLSIKEHRYIKGMRLLNSVCRVIASAYSGVPVHIEEVPNNFERNSFYVTLATGSSELKNINVYEDDPIFQIVYFAKRNEANQVVAEKLYEVKEELKRLFLLKRVVPVIPLAGVKEKPRYAKIENYSDDVRVSEGALYVKITLNFTEDVPVEDNYELIGDVDIETKTVTNG